MNSGSVKAVTMPPESVTYIARRASPSARSTPESAMPSAHRDIGGDDDRQHAARDLARRAPARASGASSAASRKIHSSTRQQRGDENVIARPEAASRRARGRSPAPSARDTFAEIAMVKPILTDISRKDAWLA